MSKIKLKVGDVFRFKQPDTDIYVFGRAVFYVPKEKRKHYFDINRSGYLNWYGDCFLVDIFDQFTSSKIFGDR